MSTMLSDGHGRAIQVLTIGSVKVVAVGAASQQSTAYTKNAVVRFATDVACHLVVGENPTATTNDTYLPAGSVEYLGVANGDKVAVIQASAAGNLWLTTME